jgi:predicted phage terminase large subunit-like protein
MLDTTIDEVAFQGVTPTDKELFHLGEADAPLWCKAFLPKTFRMSSPPEHQRMWDALDDPSKRFVNLRAYRGSAKTTIVRAFTLRRICYRVSRTVMFIALSESKAVAGVQWLRNQIETNHLLKRVYQLRPGKKWQENEIEIISELDGTTTWVLGLGITGGTRGVNFDDYRPDLVPLDDVINEENSGTLEQREKITDLILGSIANTLAPPTEASNAKMVMLQTPLHEEDASGRAMRNPMWHTETFSCWTPATIDLPAGMQRSSWEVRFPTSYIQKIRDAHIFENKLSLFAREWECRLTTPETSSFKPHWIQYYDEEVKSGMSILAIDPVPPPSKNQLAKGLRGKDMEVHLVLTKARDGYYVREYASNNNHEPNWTIKTALELAIKYNVIRIAIETVAYQLVLKSLIEGAMRRIGRYFAIEEVSAVKSKLVRITNALSGPLSQGRIFLRRSHIELIQQLNDYPNTSHDDYVDVLAIAVASSGPAVVDLDASEYGEVDESMYPDLQSIRRCP